MTNLDINAILMGLFLLTVIFLLFVFPKSKMFNGCQISWMLITFPTTCDFGFGSRWYGKLNCGGISFYLSFINLEFRLTFKRCHHPEDEEEKHE